MKLWATDVILHRWKKIAHLARCKKTPSPFPSRYEQFSHDDVPLPPAFYFAIAAAAATGTAPEGRPGGEDYLYGERSTSFPLSCGRDSEAPWVV